MCYKLRPTSLFSYLLLMHKDTEEITFKNLREIRSDIENEDSKIYVLITKMAISDTVKSYPGIFKMEDTKIIINRDKIDEIREELKENIKEIPPTYKNLLKRIVNKYKELEPAF